MSPILLIKCKVKILASAAMLSFGIVASGAGVYLVATHHSLWWLLAVVLGIFCIYNWTKILIEGGRTLVFLVQEEILYVSFNTFKEIVENLDKIEKGQYYTHKFELKGIQNFWRYIFKLNGSVNSDALYLQYKGEKLTLADLNQYELKLEENDNLAIAQFLLRHQPNIKIGKP